jgi:hypothetical protein
MEEEQGLAQSSVMQMLEQVVAMLMQGVSPQELLQQGVPQEILEIAIEIVQQEQGGDEMEEQQERPDQGMEVGAQRGMQAVPQQADVSGTIAPNAMATRNQR